MELQILKDNAFAELTTLDRLILEGNNVTLEEKYKIEDEIEVTAPNARVFI